MATRWGICSASKISNDFCGALLSLPRCDHQIVAVAARKLEDAQAFALRFSITKAYGSYEELAQDDEIDVVYVSTIHPYHYQACQLFLSHNRHILCEKPLTLSLCGTQQLLAESQRRGTFLMEAYWSRCFPVFNEIRRSMADSELGDVKLVVANICLPIGEVGRIRQRSLGGGGLMDIGCYAVQISNMVFPGRPQSIQAQATYFPDGVDEGGCVILGYSGGGMASLSYHTGTDAAANHLAIVGTKGSITVPGCFWCPDRLLGPSGEMVFPFPPCSQDFNFKNSIGFIYEINTVRECLLKGLKECPVISHADTEDIMYILEQIQKKLGITYDFK